MVGSSEHLSSVYTSVYSLNLDAVPLPMALPFGCVTVTASNCYKVFSGICVWSVTQSQPWYLFQLQDLFSHFHGMKPYDIWPPHFRNTVVKYGIQHFGTPEFTQQFIESYLDFVNKTIQLSLDETGVSIEDRHIHAKGK